MKKILLTPSDTLTVTVPRPALIEIMSEGAGFDPKLVVEYQTIDELRQRVSQLQRLNRELHYELDRYQPRS